MRNATSRLRTTAGRPYGHVPGHDYLDVEILAGSRNATLTITWGSCQGSCEEEHGREEYTRRASDAAAAIEAVRDAALHAAERALDVDAETRRYVEAASSRALVQVLGEVQP